MRLVLPAGGLEQFRLDGLDLLLDFSKQAGRFAYELGCALEFGDYLIKRKFPALDLRDDFLDLLQRLLERRAGSC